MEDGTMARDQPASTTSIGGHHSHTKSGSGPDGVASSVTFSVFFRRLRRRSPSTPVASSSTTRDVARPVRPLKRLWALLRGRPAVWNHSQPRLVVREGAVTGT